VTLAEHPGFVRFWLASTVSDFGTFITTLALQVFIVVTLHGTAADVGWVSAARWLPYVVVGLLAGMFLDRWNRRTVLISTDLVRALILGGVAVIGAAGSLSITVLALLIGAFGLLSLFNDAASQSFVPHLVPRPLLTPANARLEQSAAVAQTTGPALAGALITAFGAPLAIVVDAVTHVLAGVVMTSVHPKPGDEEPAAVTRASWRTQVGEGLRWVYRHPQLGPLALTDHSWFLFNGMLGAVFVIYALDELGFSAFVLGITLACAGLGGVLGSSASTSLGRQSGHGPAMLAARAAYAPATVALALAPGAAGTGYRVVSLVLVGIGQFVFGVAMGVEGPLELGYRQTITPDRLQGRMNATIRSVNRSMIVVGAPVGGLLATRIGYRPTLWVCVAGFALTAVAFGLSKMSRADLERSG